MSLLFLMTRRDSKGYQLFIYVIEFSLNISLHVNLQNLHMNRKFLRYPGIFTIFSFH